MNAIDRVMADAGNLVNDRLMAEPDTTKDVEAAVNGGHRPFCVTLMKVRLPEPPRSHWCQLSMQVMVLSIRRRHCLMRLRSSARKAGSAV